MDNILSLDELKSRISDYYTEKKAADMPSEQDPQETTPPNFVKDDGDDAGKMVVPEAAVSATNTDGSAENNIPGMSEGEASGKAPGKTESTDVTADKSKQKEDEAVSDPVTAKVANEGLSLAERIKSRLMGKEAGYGKDEAKSEKSDDKGDKKLSKEQEEELPEVLKEEIKESSSEKSAEEVASDFDMHPDAYRKIAHLVLGYEEGRDMLNTLADKELGKQAAEQLISEAEELGRQEHAQLEAHNKQAAYVQQLASTASEADVKAMQKMASIHGSAINKFEHDFEKQAYDAGAEQAAMAADEEDGMIPGNEGEDISIEEIAEIVMAMVESGELDPQMAEAILAELAGGAPEGGDPAAMGGEEAMMDPAMAEEAAMMDPAMAEEMKAASTEVEKAASLISKQS
jgi:hypothetical protein